MGDHFVDVTLCTEHEGCHRIDADLGAEPLTSHIRYEVHDCGEHDDCTAIVFVQQGVFLSLTGLSDEERDDFAAEEIEVSEHPNGVVFTPAVVVGRTMHADAAVHPECRLNDVYPLAVDYRDGRKQVIENRDTCEDCRSRLSEGHRR